MAETVKDIIGKGFAYEERVEVEQLYDRIETTIGGFVGVANWGPTDTATKVQKNFKSYFGTEVNRDQSSKDYSGITAARFLKYSGLCLFTRITDGTDSKASKVLMKLAKPGALIGEEVVGGKLLKVTDECNRYITAIDGASDVTVTVATTAGAAALTSSELPLLITDPLAKNYNVGDYFEFYVDGIIYQYIISSATNILCRLTTGDDSLFGGKASENVINYVDRLIYAIKSVVVGNSDAQRLVRKVGTNKVSVNSQEVGSSSSIRINSFPIAFPTATNSSPLQSYAMNTRMEDIIEQINTIIAANASAFVSSDGKYKTQTNLTGASSSICVKEDTQISLTSYFTDNFLSGAGAFLTDPSASWTQLTNGMINALNFFTNQTTTFNNGNAGTDATAGSQSWGFTAAKTTASSSGLDNSTAPSHTGTIDLTAGHDWSGTNQSFTLNYQGLGVQTITLTANCANAAAVASHIKTVIDTAFPGNTITVTAGVGGLITISSSTTGTSETIVLAAGTPDALATIGWTAASYAGTNGSTYTATITVDGVDKAISVVAIDAATLQDVIDEINTDLGASATASWDATGNGFIKVTSATTGATSTVAIVDTNLFSSITDHNAAAETAVAGLAATSGYAEIVFPTLTLVSGDDSLVPAGTYIVRATLNGGAAADASVTLVGNETWGQVASMMAAAITGCSGSVVGGRIRITSATTGTSSNVVLAEGSAAAVGVSLTYNAGNHNVSIATTASNKVAQRLSQRFLIASGGYEKMELYFGLTAGSYTTGVIRLAVYKGRNRIAFRNVVASDVTNGVVRVEFYGLGAGIYTMSFEPAIEDTATTLIVDNLYVGPYRNLRNNNLLNALGIKSNSGSYNLTYDAVLRPENLFYGTDANLNMGTLEAYYTGSDGNLVNMRKSTDSNDIETLVFTFDGTLVGQISNFSYNTADALFFGNMINNDSEISKYVKYIAPSPLPTTIEKIEDGDYTLSGGTSGIDNVTDTQYSVALAVYKNMDIYDVDIVTVSGNSSEIVLNAIQSVCEFRRDCFGIFDPPEVVAGKPGGVATGGATQMIYWHNGQLPALLSKKLDSKYITTYFPWILIDANSSSNSRQWHAPSVVVAPTIARCDLENTPYVAPAGTKAYISDIYDIAYYLKDEEKGKIYDDYVGNNINPIVYTSRQGFFIDGQKTTQRELNAYNRISAMRISLFIKRRLMNIVPQFFYQPITKDTFARFKASIETNIMSILETNNAIKPSTDPDYGWKVVVDSTVNSQIVEAMGGMIAVISFTPRKIIEKIKVISILKDTQVTIQF